MTTKHDGDTFFCELSDLGLIRFTGPDAASFLHGQVTCDINGLARDQSRYGGYCTPKGRLLATFLAWRDGDSVLLQLPEALRESVQKRLSMYILRAKVKADDATDAFARIGLGGPKARELAASVVGAAPATPHGVARHGEAALLALPGGRIEIVAPADKAAPLRAALAAAAASADAAAWQLSEIQAGVPVILPATQDAFVPQMVNLDLIGGVSYSKGCYPGQEIVARMHYLGRLKSRAFLAHLDGGAPRPGDALYSADFGEQASGTVVNAAATPSGGYDVLAVIQTASAAGGPVRWKRADGPALAIRPLPYSA